MTEGSAKIWQVLAKYPEQVRREVENHAAHLREHARSDILFGAAIVLVSEELLDQAEAETKRATD